MPCRVSRMVCGRKPFQHVLPCRGGPSRLHASLWRCPPQQRVRSVPLPSPVRPAIQKAALDVVQLMPLEECCIDLRITYERSLRLQHALAHLNRTTSLSAYCACNREQHAKGMLLRRGSDAAALFQLRRPLPQSHKSQPVTRSLRTLPRAPLPRQPALRPEDTPLAANRHGPPLQKRGPT